MSFNLNGRTHDIPPDWTDEPVLFRLREHFGLTGTKLGCGVGMCGACTVIIDGVATRSCITRAGDVEGLSVRAIEGLAEADKVLRIAAGSEPDRVYRRA